MIGAGLWQGLALGYGAAIPIGPVNVEIIRRGLAGGFWPAFTLGLGACSADTAYVLLILGGVGTWLQGRWVHAALALFATLFLGWLAGRSLLGAWRHRRSRRSRDVLDLKPVSAAGTGTAAVAGVGPAGAESAPVIGGKAAPGDPVSAGWRAYLTGLGMTIANPYNIGFWISVSGATGAHAGSWLSVAAGVIMATVSWVVGLATALARGRRFYGPETAIAIDAASGLIMLAFAAQAAWGLAAW
ncbi:MAG TPA: LysE family transporter [Limnochordia bacterium]|nr:LysE family transporter [Limnochordia bacterium]